MTFEGRVGWAWPWMVGTAVIFAVPLKSLWPIALLVLLPLVVRGWYMRHGRQLRMYREFTAGVLAEALLAAVVVTSIGVSILSLRVPLLNWGWFSVVARATGDASGGATNVVVVPLEIPLLAVPFLLLLLWVLPDLAAAEERVFRLGTRGWLDGLWRSVVFAMAHLVMGIPIGALLPLTLAGLWMTWRYFRGGAERSTRYHLAYNLCLVGVAVLVFVLLPLALGEAL